MESMVEMILIKVQECMSCSNIAGDVCSGGVAWHGASFLLFVLIFIMGTIMLLLS